jgi:glutathione S-transferase
MLALLYTTGSPFARAVRIVLDEIGLDYERHERSVAPNAGQLAPPTLQVPAFWDGELKLWESGTIAEYLLSTFPQRPAVDPPLANQAFRADAIWRDKLVFSTIQTFGTAASNISQMKWTGVALDANAHLARSAEKLSHILGWLDGQLTDAEGGFQPGFLSIHDIFLAAHVRFVQARPLGIDLFLQKYEKVASLLERLDERDSFKANPIWWWEPGIVGYKPDGTPVCKGGDRPA